MTNLRLRGGALAAVTLSVLAIPALNARSQAELATQTVESRTELTARYVANEGFLVEGGGNRVLIDALFGAGVSGYPAPPQRIRDRIELGASEWGDVAVALASHYHPDHFDAASVRRFLRANPEALFVSTPQAEAAVRAIPPEDSELLARLRGVLPAPGKVESLLIDGIRIDVLNLHHGARNPPVDNLGFVVTLGSHRFLHFGDTEAKMEDFEPYLELLKGTDLAILPFWFLSSEWRANLVRDLIRPRWILAAHMPLADAPAGYFGRWNSYAELASEIRSGFPDVVIQMQPGDSFQFGE